MAVVKSEVLKLYKALLKEGGKFTSYNFRMYALRRIRDRFQENKAIIDPVEIESFYQQGLKNLDVLKRQVIIDDLYKPERLVVENIPKEKKFIQL